MDDMENERPYKIRKKSGSFVLVLSTTYESPLSYISVLEDDLSARSFIGTVLFDLLLCNGNEYNRFVEFTFEKGKINRASRSTVSIIELDDSTLEISKNFYKANRLLLERNHILLEEEKRELICS